jgi:hypothetical protein
MSFKKSVFVAAVTVASLMSSQAFAIRVNDRPPPNGLNGPSVQGLAAMAKQDGFPAHSSKVTSVTFPDGSRASVN